MPVVVAAEPSYLELRVLEALAAAVLVGPIQLRELPEPQTQAAAAVVVDKVQPAPHMLAALAAQA
jgi:hypothetical protein